MIQPPGTAPAVQDPETASSGRPLRAAGLMLLASALIAATTLLAKALGRGAGGGEGLHPLQVSAGRFGFACLALLMIAAVLRPSLKGAPWGLHAARSAAGWVGVSCLFAAAAAMPLADATAISFLSPMVAMALAALFLAERVGPWRWGAAAIAFAGALILIRPGAAAFQPAALIALAAALAMGVETIFIKRLTGREPLLRILLVNNAIGAVLALAAASLVWTGPSAAQWAMLAALGLVMLMAQVCFVSAMRLAEASYAMPFFYATLVFAAIYDAAIFGDRPDLLGAAGAAVILSGGLLLAWREAIHARRAGLALSRRSGGR